MDMRLSVGLLVGALAALSAHAQQSALTSESPARPPVGQGVDGDWAYVARYHDANRPLNAKAAPKRVVFMGDSITEGWGRQPFIKNNPSYVGRGISGQTSPQMLVRFRSDVLALKPAVVHIMAGTNDIAQNTGHEAPEDMEGYIKDMVELALDNHVKVVLASILPSKDFWWHRGLEPAPQIRAFNGWLREYAAERGLVYVDYWSALTTPDGSMRPEFSADGVHPDQAGFEAMRPLAEAAIQAALRGRPQR
jgi:acyl-CoA thioesterase-1